MAYAVIDDHVYFLDDDDDTTYLVAYAAMRDAGISETPVYVGDPDCPDSYRGSTRLLLPND